MSDKILLDALEQGWISGIEKLLIDILGQLDFLDDMAINWQQQYVFTVQFFY